MTPFQDQRPTDKAVKEFIKKRASKELGGAIIKPMRNAYVSPRGYLPWNEHLGRLATCTLIADMQASGNFEDFFDHVDKEDSDVGKLGALLVLCSLALKAPPRYLSFNLFEVISMTDPPEFIDIPETPMPAFHLFLPRGCFRTEDNQKIDVLTIVDEAAFIGMANNYVKPENRTLKTKFDIQPGFRVIAFTEYGVSYLSGFSYSDKPDNPKERERVILDYLESDPKTVGQVTNRMTGIAVNTLMAMLCEPELIEVGELPPASRSPRGFLSEEPSTGPLPPVWIGRNYRRPIEPRTISIGDGPPRRPHWRRGHWKNVRCGPGWSESRPRWIKPVYVNAMLSSA